MDRNSFCPLVSSPRARGSKLKPPFSLGQGRSARPLATLAPTGVRFAHLYIMPPLCGDAPRGRPRCFCDGARHTRVVAPAEGGGGLCPLGPPFRARIRAASHIPTVPPTAQPSSITQRPSRQSPRRAPRIPRANAHPLRAHRTFGLTTSLGSRSALPLMRATTRPREPRSAFRDRCQPCRAACSAASARDRRSDRSRVRSRPQFSFSGPKRSALPATQGAGVRLWHHRTQAQCSSLSRVGVFFLQSKCLPGVALNRRDTATMPSTEPATMVSDTMGYFLIRRRRVG